jgi:hypothetical protein
MKRREFITLLGGAPNRFFRRVKKPRVYARFFSVVPQLSTDVWPFLAAADSRGYVNS